MELKSKQLADLVGVSVRTLRYYHQIGLLDEPRRTSSGYRLYDVDHVLQLLRIKRLANLGLSLDTVKTLLGDLGDRGSRDVLERLDHDLERQIQVLEGKRRTVRAILESGTPLDVLPEFAEYTDTIANNGTGEIDKLLLEVIGGIGHPEEIRALRELMRLAMEEPYASRFHALDARFQALGDPIGDFIGRRDDGQGDEQTIEQTIERLANDYAEALEALRARFLETHEEIRWPDDALSTLTDSLIEQKLNDHQLQVVNRVMAIYSPTADVRSTVGIGLQKSDRKNGGTG